MGDLEITLTSPDFKSKIDKANTFQLKIKNISKAVKSSIISFQPPLNAAPFSYLEVNIDKLEPEGVKTVELQYRFSLGGRYVFYYWEKEAQLKTLGKAVFFVSGPGVYSGDVHNHSVYSDGKNTLPENRESMIDKGHSFLYSTDHNTLKHSAEISEFVCTEGAGTFLHMAGWEYTTKHGHALAYGVDELYDADSITEYFNIEQWQKFVDDMGEKGGIVFLAHPYEAPRYEFGTELLLNIKNITGIEVWNGFSHHALAWQNRKAFETWDAMNQKGDSHYIGGAVSDAHTMEKHGNPYIKGFLPDLSQNAVHELLRNGKFFGSNGPEIQFNIGTAGIGETLHISDDIETVCVRFTIFDPAGKIENIILYKGMLDKKATGTIGGNNMVKALEIYPESASDRRYCEKQFFTDVAVGEFYRIEVVTAFGIVSYDKQKSVQEKGFAYTNPIWIEK